MSSAEPEDVLVSLLGGSLRASSVKDVAALHRLCLTTVIRDFDFEEYDIYTIIWRLLRWMHHDTLSHWYSQPPDSLDRLRCERLCWEVWQIAAKLDEFSIKRAVGHAMYEIQFVESVLQRFVALCSIRSNDADAGAAASKSVEPRAPAPVTLKRSKAPLIAKAVQKYMAHFLHWTYMHRVDYRPALRKCLGMHLQQSVASSSSAHGNKGTSAGTDRTYVSILLAILESIIIGLQPGGRSRYEWILRDVIMPLHNPNEMTLWRDQRSEIQQYHPQLIRCLRALIEKDKEECTSISETDASTDLGCTDSKNCSVEQSQSGAGRGGSSGCSIAVLCVSMLLKQWPTAYATNTPKEILFIHELEKLLETFTDDDLRSNFRSDSSVLDRICSLISSSDNFRTIERTLQMFRNKKFTEVLFREATTERAAYTQLLSALYRQGQKSWNPTVNKRTALVLRKMRSLNEELFADAANCCIGSEKGNSLVADSKADSKDSDVDTKRLRTMAAPANMSASASVSRAAGMPIPRPNQRQQAKTTAIGPGMRTAMPMSSRPSASMPMTVMPSSSPAGFAAQIPRHVSASSSSLRTGIGSGGTGGGVMDSGWKPGSGTPPPVTVTGVAPWAMSKGVTTNAEESEKLAKIAALNESLGISQSGSKESINQHTYACSSSDDMQPCDSEPSKPVSGVEVLEAYMEACLPKAEAEREALPSFWNVEQAAEMPVRHPNMRFHDLVFGKELGHGAFSVVKYARLVIKDVNVGRSQWAEYAVKIISAEKIIHENYEKNVEREMAVLHSLSHPGIARLVSSFQYTESAYMVLEYGGRGDLHSYIMKVGPIPEVCTRSVVGEIVAALSSIHELGFAYLDLKPENVLITAIGHVKLTDFGGCRAVSESAVRLLAASKGALRSLRNGDWREENPAAKSTAQTAMDQNPYSYYSNPGRSDCKDAKMDVESSDCTDAKMDVSEGGDSDEQESDERLEGTPAYMPPEALLGRDVTRSIRHGESTGAPVAVSQAELEAAISASDSWALGCLTLFCDTGRPPYYGTAEQVLAQIQDNIDSTVTFFEPRVGARGPSHDNGHRKQPSPRQRALEEGDGQGEHGASLLQAFVGELHDRDMRRRLQVRAAAAHRFLTHGNSGVQSSLKGAHSANLSADGASPRNDLTAGRVAAAAAAAEVHEEVLLNPLMLHQTAPVALPDPSSGEEDGGAEGEDQGDAKLWRRRQFSVLWAPTPDDAQLAGSHGDDEAEDYDENDYLVCQSAGVKSMLRYEYHVIQESSLERNTKFH